MSVYFNHLSQSLTGEVQALCLITVYYMLAGLLNVHSVLQVKILGVLPRRYSATTGTAFSALPAGT